jgi:hypothetical protein
VAADDDDPEPSLSSSAVSAVDHALPDADAADLVDRS